MGDKIRDIDCTLVQSVGNQKQIVIALVGNPSSGKSSLHDSILRACSSSEMFYKGYKLSSCE